MMREVNNYLKQNCAKIGLRPGLVDMVKNANLLMENINFSKR